MPGRGKGLRVAHRHNQARLTDYGGRVPDIGNDAGHATRHRFPDHVRKALPVERTEGVDSQRRCDLRDVAALTEQMEPVAQIRVLDHSSKGIVLPGDVLTATDK